MTPPKKKTKRDGYYFINSGPFIVKMAELGLKSTSTTLLNYLLTMKFDDNRDYHGKNLSQYQIEITQKELADKLKTTRKNIGRWLAALNKQNILRYDGYKYTTIISLNPDLFKMREVAKSGQSLDFISSLSKMKPNSLYDIEKAIEYKENQKLKALEESASLDTIDEANQEELETQDHEEMEEDDEEGDSVQTLSAPAPIVIPFAALQDESESIDLFEDLNSVPLEEEEPKTDMQKEAVSMNAIESYELYLDIQQHLHDEDFDFFEDGGKRNLKKINNDQMKYWFERYVKEYTTYGEMKRFILCNLKRLQFAKKPDISGFTQEGLVEYRKIIESLSYKTKEEIGTLFNHAASENIKPMEMFKIMESDKAPFILKALAEKKISIETLVLMNRVLCFWKVLENVMASNEKWSEVLKVFKKYDSLLSVNTHNILDAIGHHYDLTFKLMNVKENVIASEEKDIDEDYDEQLEENCEANIITYEASNVVVKVVPDEKVSQEVIDEIATKYFHSLAD